MTRFLHRVFFYVLLVLLPVDGAITTSHSVLCLGPGNHCHLETIVGRSCDIHQMIPDRSLPRPRDGCPRGSKDFRLGVDTHRTGNTRAVAALAEVPFAISLLRDAADSLRSRPAFSPLAISQKSARCSVVLRC